MYIYIYQWHYLHCMKSTGRTEKSAIDRACVWEKDRKAEVAPLLASWRCKTKGKSARIRRTEGDHPLCCNQRTPSHPLPLRCAELLHYFTERRKKTVAAPRKCHLGHLESHTDVPNWLLNRAGSVWFPQKHLNAKASHERLAFNSFQWLCPSKQCEARVLHTDLIGLLS